MLYCFDLDDVISDTYSVIMEVSLLYHRNVLSREIPETVREAGQSRGDYFYFAKSLQWNTQDVTAFYHEYYPHFLEKIKPRVSSRCVLQKLHDEGHQICILSARELRDYADVEQLTNNWLTEHQIPCDRLIVGAKQKQPFLERMQCGVFVDDDFWNCIAAVNALVPRVFYYRCEYNQGFPIPDGTDICCINSLEELI